MYQDIFFVRDKPGSMTKFKLPTIFSRVAEIYPKAKDGLIDLTTSICFEEREDLYVIQAQALRYPSELYAHAAQLDAW